MSRRILVLTALLLFCAIPAMPQEKCEEQLFTVSGGHTEFVTGGNTVSIDTLSLRIPFVIVQDLLSGAITDSPSMTKEGIPLQAEKSTTTLVCLSIIILALYCAILVYAIIGYSIKKYRKKTVAVAFCSFLIVTLLLLVFLIICYLTPATFGIVISPYNSMVVPAVLIGLLPITIKSFIESLDRIPKDGWKDGKSTATTN